MINFVKLSRIFIILSILMGLTISSPAVDPRPPSGILDQAGLLSNATKTALSEQMRAALQDHHLELYVATYGLIRGETLTQRAVRLRDAWAQNPFAIVLVYDQSMGQMSFVGTRDLEKFVSAPELNGAFQRAAAVARNHMIKEKDAERRSRAEAVIASAVRYLIEDPILTQRMSLQVPWQFSRPMAALLTALVVLLVGAASLVWWLEKRLHQSKRRNLRCSHFPATHMPFRLEAPYSGGQGVSIGEESRGR